MLTGGKAADLGATAEGHRMTALHLRLEPGWKTYWRSPGDAGVPPRFDWAASRNLAEVR
ncbi:protein-disulfide reductase DsbD domain-containing protein, partial [Paracoccus sp. APAP_BH8]